MDQSLLIAIIALALVGLAAVIAILRRRPTSSESQFAASTEGEKRCANCGMGNMWTDRVCIACGSKLPG